MDGRNKSGHDENRVAPVALVPRASFSIKLSNSQVLNVTRRFLLAAGNIPREFLFCFRLRSPQKRGARLGSQKEGAERRKRRICIHRVLLREHAPALRSRSALRRSTAAS